jgi:predicted amidohydrolase
MLCGLSLADCIAKTTSAVANTFNIANTGELKIGNIADFSIIKISDTPNVVEDSVGKTLNNNIKLENKGVFINGKHYPTNFSRA